MDKDCHNNMFTPRENFLMVMLQKVISEYKTLLESARQQKPLKIVEITSMSSVPGETRFIIQVTKKNSIVHLSAAEIINANYDLNQFSDFHAEMIRQAVLGRLAQFLKLTDEKPIYSIVSKRFDAKIKQYVFTIETQGNIRFTSTAEKLSRNKNLLSNVDADDIYDIAYTRGTESILHEKELLVLAKRRDIHTIE